MASRVLKGVVGAVAFSTILLVSGLGLLASLTGSGSASPAPGGAAGASDALTVVAGPFLPGPDVAELGAVPASTPVSVAVGLASQNVSGLAAFVAAVSAPGSVMHGEHLSAAAATGRFGASPVSVAGAEAYFEQRGLSVAANPDGLLLEVSGPSGPLAAAFHTTLERYALPDGRVVMDHPTPATLPSSIPWTGVIGLDNLSALAPEVGPAAVAPLASPAGSCPGYTGELVPCQIDNAYNTSSLIANGTNGSGERIAVVDPYVGDEPQSVQLYDYQAFSTDVGLPQGGLSFLYPVPTSTNLNSSSVNPAWGLEDSLDTQWAHAAAPGAQVEMTYSPNGGYGLYLAIDWLVAHAAANVISLSWGEPDVGIENAYAGPCSYACNASTDGSYALLTPVFELAAAEGISVFAASGDCGASDGTSGVAVNFPASDPYVTGVGGTSLGLSGTQYGSESAWSGNSSGAHAPGCENQGGSGGGYAQTPEPWWQSGLPSGHATRGVPDVAMDAGTPVEIVNGGGVEAVEGTSVGTPIWAGIAAIADDADRTDLGLLNPALYQILQGPRYAQDFHDIVSGSNGYSARAGWDPVTGIGTPKVAALISDLRAGGALPGNGLAVQLRASTRSGPAPLAVTFTVDVSGGTLTYPVVGVAFGDFNASETTTGTVGFLYPTAGVYLAQAYAFDSSGNESVSVPVPIVVGGGSVLSVSLVASASTPPPGAGVNLTAYVSGGTAPYVYDFVFGDGSYALNMTSPLVTHAYAVAGEFCAFVSVTDTASLPDGGWADVPVDVGGPGPSACNATAPSGLALTFDASGLPVGVPWTVTVDNVTRTAIGATIGFDVVNATYTYELVPAVFGYGGWFAANRTGGSVDITGADVTISVGFSTLSTTLLTFRESGLPKGAAWGVVVGYGRDGYSGTTTGTAEPAIVPLVPVPYTLTEPTGYGVARVTGGAVVNESWIHPTVPGVVKVAFGPIESLSFLEIGLPSGTLWGVTVRSGFSTGGPPSQTATSTAASLTFTVVKESWKYQVSTKPSTWAPTRGHGTARPPNFAVTIDFKLVTEKVVFHEAGLPAHTVWGVNVTGPMNDSVSGAKGSLTVLLENGSYSFQVWNLGADHPQPSSGTLTVVAPHPAVTVKIAYSSQGPAHARALAPDPPLRSRYDG